MKSKGKRPANIDEYIALFPPLTQKRLREMRECVRKTAPTAREEIKWGMPAFSGKRILVMFGGFKNHIGFYPTPSPIRAFAKELNRFNVATGSIQFPLDKPLPKMLIKKIVRYRIRESLEADRKWKS